MPRRMVSVVAATIAALLVSGSVMAGDVPLSMTVTASRAPRGEESNITATLRNTSMIQVAAVDVPVALTVSGSNLPPRLVAVRNTGSDQRARFTWRVSTSVFVDNVTATCTTGGNFFKVTVASTRVPIG